MKDAVVRPATIGDAAAVRALIAGMGGHDEVAASHGFFDVFAEVLGSSVRVAFVAEVDGVVAGYAELHRRPSTLHAVIEGWLAALAVDSGARRAGVGRALIAAVDAAAIRLGCDELVLESSRSREAARSFYLSLGFVDQTEAHRYRRRVGGTG